MLEIIQDAFFDSMKLVPILLLMYFLLEYFENKNNSNRLELLLNKFGPLLGALFGVLPQCGMGVLGASLFIENKITVGTLISIFIATSDEAIPILIAHVTLMDSLIFIIFIKIFIAIIVGYSVDVFYHPIVNKKIIKKQNIEKNIFESVLYRTATITFFIFLVNLILNLLIHQIGENNLSNLLLNHSFYQPIVASIFGFIPNCSISVILSELYIHGGLSLASLCAGLITNAGIGIIILFKYIENKKIIFNIFVILFVSATSVGLFLELF